VVKVGKDTSVILQNERSDGSGGLRAAIITTESIPHGTPDGVTTARVLWRDYLKADRHLECWTVIGMAKDFRSWLKANGVE
jgi:hypothetical protein